MFGNANSQLKNLLTFSLLFFLCGYLAVGQAGKQSFLRDVPLRNHYDLSVYNGGIQSWGFDQTSAGILYIANNNGLFEFDGSRWSQHVVPSCTKVRAVMVDSQDRIFVGGQGQIGYFVMQENGLQFTSLLDKLPQGLRTVSETWKILEHQGNIFINTESQLFMLEKDSIHVLDLPGYTTQISTIGNRLVAQFYNSGLFELEGKSFISLPGTSDLPDIIAIFPSDDGLHYFSFSGAIFKQDDTGIHPIETPFVLGAVNSVLELSAGGYAVGTQNNGLFFLDSELSIDQHLTKNEGLSDRTIKSLYEDNFHNLWVALNNGIDYLQLSLPFSLINEEVGLEGTGYAACKYRDRVYMGTSNGLFLLQQNAGGHPAGQYELAQGSDGQVYNFSIIEEDLILNHDKGAFRIVEGELEQFHDLGSWKFVQTAIPGLILGGDYQGMAFFRKIGGKWTKVRSIEGFYESSRMMEFENDSVLWMTHGSKGAYRFTFDDSMQVAGDIAFFGKEAGFPSNLLISVYPLLDKLIFTAEHGIYNYNYGSNSFVVNSFFNKWLGMNHVSEIISNGRDAIYYIQDQQMGILTQEAFGSYKNQRNIFRHINKLINDDLPNISLIDDDNILIGAKEGFIRYKPQYGKQISNDFQVLLKSVEIRTSLDSSITFSPFFIQNKEVYKKQSIKFQYAAPYFDGIEEIKFSYRLLPLEDSWSEWSAASEKEYTYLPAGNHTFEVKALNVYGMESPVAAFSITVGKPWYLSTWALMMFTMVGLVAVLLILYLQQKKFKTEKSIINRDQQEVLKSKNEEIDQISSNSKKEIDRLLNEKLQSEIDLKNDRLTTITMLFMNKNEFILDIRKRIETYLKGGSNRELQRLIKTIDDNLSDNNSWDQFAYHFDQVHGDYLKKLGESNVKLSPREIKLAAFLRMNMSSKEISNLLNITPRSVELARYRLRKKLKLDREQNLVEYLIELDSE